MFGQHRTTEAHEPLLGAGSHDHDEVADDSTVFKLDSDDESSALDDRRDHTVRFEENVQVIPPLPLRSMLASRETEFEQDTDDIDEDALIHVPPGRRDRSMPLIVGLFDSAASRGRVDVSVPLLQNGEQPHMSDAELEELAAKRTAGGGVIDSIANMANSILGAGIIGLPYAVSQAGFFTGLFLLVVLACLTDWTIGLIVINAKLSGTHSYIDIMSHCFGSSGRAAVSFFQFAFAFGGMCAFGIIIGDTIPHVMRSIFPRLYTIPVLYLLQDRRFVIALLTTCVSYPLSLYRDIHKLSKASGLALVGMVTIVTSVLIESPHAAPELRGDPSKRFSFIEPGVFQAIGVISFAFVCHHNSLLIYGSLKTPTLDRFALVTHISTLISVVACCTLALSAYVVFTDKTEGNILNNFSPNSTLINVARFCFGLNMFTTLPLELFVCREVIEEYFFSHESFNLQRHVFFTTTILFASMLVALITCDLGVMLEITGGVSATTLAFIFPASCYLKLTDSKEPWYSRSKLPAYACAVFGVVVMIISLYLALGKTWTPEGSARICI
ncbi:amino acid transporter [Roridomyces roridus]|uniref:Amino acid transporter n=1 Tax=Roridomyces roridus TaxID=1738132 RepID=A0AAD7CHF4_9AGAR|nr:amino acid transporter [Roridomyces roridus]